MSEKAFEILILEDNVSDIYLLRLAFAEVNLSPKLVEFYDGDAALQHMQIAPPPDLALLDINVPNSNGLTVLRTLRRDERYARLPVVMASGSNFKGEREEAAALGVVRFFNKPQDFEEFIQMAASIKEILHQTAG